ncbi:MAG TPA: restriction endonuclease subunit S [Bryobacteraceae bacterium]|nr:restriction endonuclease subunit S [Bryobacteraceae bacterium]
MSWAAVKLESIKADVRFSLVGGPFGSELTTKHYVEEGVPVIRGSNLLDDRCFHDQDFVFVREEKADQLFSNNAFPGDVVFTQRGTLGQVGIIPTNSTFPRYLISQSQMKLTVNPAKADPKFIYYYFRSPETVQSIKNRAITSGVPHINLGILRGFEIPLPPLATQCSIVSTLSAYDDLIENNRRRMALLEKAARLLYEEWFVRLRFPGYEHTVTSAVVPRGWERVPLEYVLMLQRGFDLPIQDRVDGAVPIYGSTGISGYHEKSKVEGPGIVTGRSGTLGEVHYVRGSFWPLNTALWVKEFRRVTPIFALFLLRSIDLKQFNGGASVPTLDRKSIHKVEVLVPPPALVTTFTEFANPLFDQIANLTSQNHSLKTARDLLLPRLTSGEIPV